MTVSTELQKAVIARLRTHPGVSALVGARIYDRPPDEPVPPYITLGPSDFTVSRPDELSLREETLQIDIWSEDDGNQTEAKDITDQVVEAFEGYSADMGTHALVDVSVFQVRVLRAPDNVTVHGVVQIECQIEAN